MSVPPQLPAVARKVPRDIWLRKHADYQRVYRKGKRQSLPLMAYFYALREPGSSSTAEGPRVGLTAGKVLGNAVQRNRIKRRMREAVRRKQSYLTASVDVILHPRKTVLEAEFSQIERDVAQAFRKMQMSLRESAAVGGKAE
ncbi:MAG TPA: ribonuclease P protein component [Acidobacteriaceae bacterium]|nr:ribonuclease P protein component [Acidobacteriaceae bacterium]